MLGELPSPTFFFFFEITSAAAAAVQRRPRQQGRRKASDCEQTAKHDGGDAVCGVVGGRVLLFCRGGGGTHQTPRLSRLGRRRPRSGQIAICHPLLTTRCRCRCHCLQILRRRGGRGSTIARDRKNPSEFHRKTTPQCSGCKAWQTALGEPSSAGGRSFSSELVIPGWI